MARPLDLVMPHSLLAGLAVLAVAVTALAFLTPAAARGATFAAPMNYPVPPLVANHGLQSVVVGNFNGDSDPDLAVAHQDGDKISVLLGSTNGTFTGPTDFGLFSHANPLSVAVGYFNDDSDPDLAVANEGSSTGDPPGKLSILLGSTGGTFTASTNYTAGTRPQGVSVGEFNGDGDQDLAVANEGGDVSVFLGVGDGTFGAPTSHTSGITPRGVAVADFNGDSDHDLAVANKDSDNVSVFLGGSEGSFGTPTSYSSNLLPHAIAVGQFDGGSDPDLVVVNETLNSVSVLLGGADGSFGSPASFGVGSIPDAVAVGEFNGDGDPDLAVANQNSDNVSVLSGTTGGSFTGLTNFTVGDAPTSVAVGNFNADPYQDLAVTNEISNTVSILLGVATYPRPSGGNTFRVPLVPAFAECTQALKNSLHGGDLQSDDACSNSALRTVTATLGTSTSAGTRIGYADISVCNNTTASGLCAASAIGTAPDVRLRGNASDVVCQSGASAAACPGGPGSDYDPDTAAGPYSGNLDLPADSNSQVPTAICKPGPPNPPTCAVGADMTATAVIPGSSVSGINRTLRITDAYSSKPSSGDPPGCGSTTSCSATVRDQAFAVPVVCRANTTPGLGSYCGVNTTANALVPGVVEAGKGAVVEVGQLQVFDSGPDGVRANADDQLFAVQGIYIP